MSTRGNFVFCRAPIKEIEGSKPLRFAYDVEAIDELKKGISNETSLVKDGYKIYIHSDNYPSYAIPNLIDFLKIEGARRRAEDTSYLSAWFVAYYAANELLPFNLPKPEGVSFEEYGKWYFEYEPKGEDIKKVTDFGGIGLEHELDDWADYTYVIVPDISLNVSTGTSWKRDGFWIYIYDGGFNFVDVIHRDDDLEELKLREWWD